MSILKINGIAIADPKTIKWDISDLDSEDGAGRTQDGLMHRDRVAVKRKLTCTWSPMGPLEMATLLQAMDDVLFSLEYPDAHDGTTKTGTFYVGDRSTPIDVWSEKENRYLWEGLSANFVEQ